MNLNAITEKIKDFNLKVEDIINREFNKIQNQMDPESFYQKNIDLLNETKDVLESIKYDVNRINSKQERANDEMDFSLTGKNIKEKNKLEESFKEVGTNINNLFERVTPTGFVRFIAKEMLDALKEINKYFKNFDEKIKKFEEKVMEKEVDKNLSVLKNVDIDKIKENGLLGLDKNVLNSLFNLEKIQEKLIKSGVIDEKTATMLKEGNFDELAKTIASKAIPVAGLVSSLIDFNKNANNILNAMSDFIKNKSQELNMSPSNVVSNQLQFFDSSFVGKLKTIIESIGKEDNPVVQTIQKGINEVKKSPTISHKSRSIER